MEDDAHRFGGLLDLDNSCVFFLSCEHSSSEASSLIGDKLPNTNNVIRGQNGYYAVGRKISQGRFGAVYEVLRRGDGKHLAAKLEVCDSHFHGLNVNVKRLNLI